MLIRISKTITVTERELTTASATRQTKGNSLILLFLLFQHLSHTQISSFSLYPSLFFFLFFTLHLPIFLSPSLFLLLPLSTSFFLSLLFSWSHVSGWSSGKWKCEVIKKELLNSNLFVSVFRKNDLFTKLSLAQRYKYRALEQDRTRVLVYVN